jgi:signal transduction histidine kinase
MPDEGRAEPGTDGAVETALANEARLVRRVRWRLVAWSGLSTLVVLVALGAALYAAVATTLAAASVAQLSDRVDPWVARLEGQDAGPEAPPGFGFLPGRGNTFLFAFDAVGGPVQLGLEPVIVLAGLPEEASLEAARAAPDGRDVRTDELDMMVATVPVRLLTQRLVYAQDGQTYFLQALQDRSTEVETLTALVRVLVVGGLLAVVAALALGAVYARRALVPIRASLAAQRDALRRQREFAADASHELRTPLTVIRSSVEHIGRHPERPVSASADALEDIDVEVAHLTSLVDDLLLLARSDSGVVEMERATLDLGEAAVDAASALARAAEAREVRVTVDPEPAPVEGDPTRLRQVVSILVDNAIRHSPRDGQVGVVVRAAGGTAWVEVADDGPGLRPEDMAHVFDRFWRAPGAPSGGTGLGLSIARWIVERHGGRIGVANRDGGGAVFRVELPISPG